MFEFKFTVFEYRDSGACITHYLHGKKKDVKRKVDILKEQAKCYEMLDKHGMIMWA